MMLFILAFSSEPFSSFWFMGVEPKQKVVDFTRMSLVLRKWVGFKGKKSQREGTSAKWVQISACKFLSSTCLIIELCHYRARSQETWQKTVVKSQTDEREFPEHSAGEANIDNQTLLRWRGLTKIQAFLAETSGGHTWKILLWAHGRENYGLGVGTNWISLLGIDLLVDSVKLS